MKKNNIIENIVSTTENNLMTVINSIKSLEFELCEKEISLEKGGYYTSDVEELSTGQWDIWIQPYIENFKVISYDARFCYNVNIKRREYNPIIYNGRVEHIYEKITFNFSCEKIIAEFHLELNHILHKSESYEDWKKDICGRNVSIVCKGVL